jgi:hypothetical protein
MPAFRLIRMPDNPETGAKPPMDERRWGQQEMLERLLETTDHIHNELGQLSVTMTDRVAKLEQSSENQAGSLTGLAIVVGRHTESISWIKGAGAASVVIIGGLIIWILSHLVFKP